MEIKETTSKPTFSVYRLWELDESFIVSAVSFLIRNISIIKLLCGHIGQLEIMFIRCPTLSRQSMNGSYKDYFENTPQVPLV